VNEYHQDNAVHGQVANRFLNVIDGVDGEAVDGDTESMTDAAAPQRNASGWCRR
jgi:hypothetical protein